MEDGEGMKTFYKAVQFGKKVIPCEVEKFTEKTVWIDGRRHALKSSYENYFESEVEAWNYLEAKAQTKVKHCKDALQRARSELGKIIKESQ